MLAEPKRVDMEVFIDDWLPSEGGPACGTVGCFAGWVVLLHGTDTRSRPDVADRARELLGPDCDYYTVSDGAFKADVFSSGNEDDIKGGIGTERYARSVVARIEKFQRINEKILKAKKL